MAKLIITRGLPGSGKTTWAKAQKGAVRVNRDDLRNMITADWPHGDNHHENVLTEIQVAAIGLLLGAGHTVIVDDTNLRPEVVKSLRDMAGWVGVEFEVKDFTHVPVEQCIANDARRFGTPAYLGAAKIQAMHDRYLASKTEVTP